MKDEEGMQIATVEAFSLVDKRIQELNNQLTEADKERKSVDATLHVAENQAETQHKQLCQTKDLFSAAKEQIRTLKMKLEEVKKAIEKAKQDGYDVGVAKTEETLKAEVSGVCRTYCLQVWNEALNQVGVEASFALRREKNVYYPPAIRASGPLSSTVEIAPMVLSSSNGPPKEAEQTEVAEKEKDITKGVVPEAIMPLAVPKDPSKGKEVSPSLEIDLTTFHTLTSLVPGIATNHIKEENSHPITTIGLIIFIGFLKPCLLLILSLCKS